MPLAFAPVVPREGNAESGVPDPVHEAKQGTRAEPIGEMILDHHQRSGDAAGLAQQIARASAVVHDIDQQHGIEFTGAEG